MSGDTREVMVKIFFEPPDDPKQDWHTEVESMWAFPVEEPTVPGGLVYKLDNSPWYVFGVSYKDEVCAELRHEVFEKPTHAKSDRLYFTRVWKRGGHSTYALFLLGGTTLASPEWIEPWSALTAMGCTYEGVRSKLFAVDVPPTANRVRVEEIFSKAEAENAFAWQIQYRYEAGA